MRKIFVSYSRTDYLDENGQHLVGSPVGTIIDALKANNNIVTMFAAANAQECGRGSTLKIKY